MRHFWLTSNFSWRPLTSVGNKSGARFKTTNNLFPHRGYFRSRERTKPAYPPFCILYIREVIKSGYFTVMLTVRGWGSTPSALTVSKCENFDPFFQWNMTLWYSRHSLSHCEGVQKCIFNAFRGGRLTVSLTVKCSFFLRLPLLCFKCNWWQSVLQILYYWYVKNSLLSLNHKQIRGLAD